MPVHEYTVAMTCGGCSGAVTRILTKQLDAEKGEKFKVREKLFKNFLFKFKNIYLETNFDTCKAQNVKKKYSDLRLIFRLIWKTSLFSSRLIGLRMRSKKSLRNAAKQPISKQPMLVEVFKKSWLVLKKSFSLFSRIIKLTP